MAFAVLCCHCVSTDTKCVFCHHSNILILWKYSIFMLFPHSVIKLISRNNVDCFLHQVSGMYIYVLVKDAGIWLCWWVCVYENSVRICAHLFWCNYLVKSVTIYKPQHYKTSGFCTLRWGREGGGVAGGGISRESGRARMVIAASKRGLQGFPLSSCTCHYGITARPPSPFALAAQSVALKIPPLSHQTQCPDRGGVCGWGWGCVGGLVWVRYRYGAVIRRWWRR